MKIFYPCGTELIQAQLAETGHCFQVCPSVFKVSLCVREAVACGARTERVALSEGAVGGCPPVILLLERGTRQTITVDVLIKEEWSPHDHQGDHLDHQGEMVITVFRSAFVLPKLLTSWCGRGTHACMLKPVIRGQL